MFSKILAMGLFVFVSFLAVPAQRLEVARGDLHWVTVSTEELATVSPEVAYDYGLSVAILRGQNTPEGISILRLTDPEIENLSRAMHQTFAKCAGFVAHETEGEALAWIQRSVNPDVPQVVNYTIDNRTTVTAMLSATSETSNRQTMIDLSAFPNRRYNLQTGVDAANWIKNTWTTLAAGHSGVSVELYPHPTGTSLQPSVVMTIRGSATPSEIVIVGAHEDSINGQGQNLAAPGADDDGSGIACLTETIRVLMTRNFKPLRTVQFIAYAAEEPGLRGSNAIATDYRNQNKNVVGVFQLDMTNYRGTLGYDIVLIQDYTNAAQNQFVRDLITAYQPPTVVVGTSSCGYACSDHASWTNRGYVASFPFEATINDDNPNIHTENDTLANCGNNANKAVMFTKLAISYVAELAKGCLSRRMPCNAISGDG